MGLKSFIVISTLFSVSAVFSDEIQLNKFLRHIFNKYGSRDTMTFEGFEHLLFNIGLGNIEFSVNHTIAQHRPNNYKFTAWNEIDDYGQPIDQETIWHEIVFKQMHEHHHHESRHSLLSRAGKSIYLCLEFH